MYEKPKIDETKLLIVMVGLPRSGKSTWARSKNFPIVNRDSIRLALHGERFLKPAEGIIKELTLLQVRSLFLAGHDVVILDETCTTRSRRNFWREGRPWTVVFKHIDTPAEECKERAIEDPEILPIIDHMAAAFEPLDTDECLMSEPPSVLDEPSHFIGVDLASEPDKTGKTLVEKTVDGQIIVKGDYDGE
jgi:predicted kinase